jgi:hypothetical protein
LKHAGTITLECILTKDIRRAIEPKAKPTRLIGCAARDIQGIIENGVSCSGNYDLAIVAAR